MPEERQAPTTELLDELKAVAQLQPRHRLHVHPESAMWIMMSVKHLGLEDLVVVVGDPACTHPGLGWIQEVTFGQWAHLRSLVGSRVTLKSTDLGTLTGTLLHLDHREAQLDLGDGDVRYLYWIFIAPEASR